MLLDTLGASLLWHLSRGKVTIRDGKDFLCHLTATFCNMKVLSKWTSIQSRNNLPKIKDGGHEINLDKYESMELTG